MASSTLNITGSAGFRLNTSPAGFDARKDLEPGLFEFLEPLHKQFTPRQQALVARRKQVLEASLTGQTPDHLPPSKATTSDWRIAVPDWCQDQRNQMTGPADEAELVVKMLNSGAPGVMLDLEDSTVNQWAHQQLGMGNILSALRGDLSYYDQKRQRQVSITPSKSVIWTRVRGLHLNQGGIFREELMSASLFDLASLCFRAKREQLKHPLSIYIPKSESAEEALWWRDVFQAISGKLAWPKDYIKCMALVESHPLAFQMEEFLYNLREHILGLNLGRWDYMASLIHWNFENPAWVLPDRNTIPHDVPFFQRLRHLLVDICHNRGALAIGGMTALYPSRADAELNARALATLEKDKRNEAACGMDGAWTGHPDQNAIAVAQFPVPNQLGTRHAGDSRYPDLRPVPDGVGTRSLAGTRAATRTVIRYRNGVLNGKGASLLDGYMEDLATDRIYRLMLAQRMRHASQVRIEGEDGQPVRHDAALLARCFDEGLSALVTALPQGKDAGDERTLKEAARQSRWMIESSAFDPD